jgi:hypothetical protein
MLIPGPTKLSEFCLFATFIILFGCSTKNAKEQEIFRQADKIIDLMKDRNFKALRESTYATGFQTAITDTGWINYASPLLRKYVPIDHSRWRLKTTDMGYEVHIPFIDVQEPDIDYRAYDFVLLHTPEYIANKFYDFRLDGNLKSAKKVVTQEPK